MQAEEWNISLGLTKLLLEQQLSVLNAVTVFFVKRIAVIPGDTAVIAVLQKWMAVQ
jgi:hypothetical protein